MDTFLADWQAPPPSLEDDGSLPLWLWEVHVTSKLPEEVPLAPPTASSHTTHGVFVVLFCKTVQGASVTLIVDDWRPWMRVLSRTNKEAEGIAGDLEQSAGGGGK